MPDSYRKKHIVQELQDTRARLLADLDARVNQAAADGEAANARLSAELDAVRDALVQQILNFVAQLTNVY